MSSVTKSLGRQDVAPHNIHSLSPREVDRSARLLKAEYGEAAPDKAKWRISTLLQEDGDASAIIAWARILVAVEELLDPC